MAENFRDEIRDKVAAKKKAQADAAQASNTSMQQTMAKRRAAVEQSLQLMGTALEGAVAGLTDDHLSASVEPLSGLENGTPQQFGHVLKLSGIGFPNTTVTLNYSNGSLDISSATKGKSHKTRNLSVATPQVAQDLVSAILKDIGLI